MNAPTRSIQRLAIVNRGEAAMRCIRAVRSLRAQEASELDVVALYTSADRDAPFVRNADRAVRISSPGGDVAAFLDHDEIVRALRHAGADAVWPGWGFVAEDPAFVERLEKEGIVFLGPSAQGMRQLGDKISSKEIAEAANVPVTAWSRGVVEDEDAAARVAREIGYPVVIKASAGGGGRGIRMVDSEAEIAEAFRSASAEAASAFGDSRLFVESRVSGGRHIEVQIIADHHDNQLAVGCRDCSVQRRHQKVLEESPPPGLSKQTLETLMSAAVRIARHVGYVGAGTVEFLVRGDEIFFLEMNPRLQVEHGITEAITGLDLVQMQIRVARGESIGNTQISEDGVAIEARVCAEDPDAGFLPAPGRISRFDPALGPRVRIDSGVTTGSSIPPAFDSLVAKVIATGADREEARARLACALVDFELVVEGGASNKGFLLDVLDCDDYRRGGVDTSWLDRFVEKRGGPTEYAVEAFVAASILAYQSQRYAARLNFYADTNTISPTSVPPSVGQEIDLNYRSEQYRVPVFAVGSWRYRVYLDDRVVAVTLREDGPNAARLQIDGRTFRVLYDTGDSDLRVEVEGHAHRFGLQTLGQVRAGTPAMVVTIHVGVGDVVEAGQTLGVLEAMKMEIGFDAPVSGTVQEVRALKGQQIAAGDILLIIDPSSDESTDTVRDARLVLPETLDPLAPLFVQESDGSLGVPALESTDSLEPAARRAAIDAVADEVRRLFLGYDANLDRAARLGSLLDAPLPEALSEDFLAELASLRTELTVFADIEQLFIRSPRDSVSGELGPSNNARLRMFARRLRAGGAGLPQEYLGLVLGALGHYGVTSLDHDDALERAFMRLLATHQPGSQRGSVVLDLLGLVTRLARVGVQLADDRRLENALERIAGMRGLVSNAVADAAVDATYLIFQRPRVERLAERTSRQLAIWLSSAETEPTPPPEEVLVDLAGSPANVFHRVGSWLSDPNPARRSIAVGAYLRRLYSPDVPVVRSQARSGKGTFERIEMLDGRAILGGALSANEVASTAVWVAAAAAEASVGGSRAEAVEIFVPVSEIGDVSALVNRLRMPLASENPELRVNLNFVDPQGGTAHRSFIPSGSHGGLQEDAQYHGIHPETAHRIDLARLANFQLERLPASEGIYCFYGKSREIPADERIFVLADVRGRSTDDGREDRLNLPAFEHAYYEATRALRSILGLRDPKRRLHWNRVVLFVAQEIVLDPRTAELMARRLAPATRNLGLEKVVVRLNLLDREDPDKQAVPTEVIISDITGSNMEIVSRDPHIEPLKPRSDYERKIVSARSRRLVYPYEIIRMLTGSGRGTSSHTAESVGQVQTLNVGSFEECDLDSWAKAPVARNVSGRPFGMNTSSVVFGIISTPTAKVPEGMRRVIILSDPTQGMGSLAAPECERIVAAIDLAEKHSLPVEWIPVSSGARIAMESGTENLDATARVVRRIVQFTQTGGVIHVLVHGVNVGAQSYWDSLATMLMHTRGALIMTPRASMVLTGRAALAASGAVSAEDEEAIGGFERIMGPNGEAQYYCKDLSDAFRLLYEHYDYTYVVPGENGPRPFQSADPVTRSIADFPVSDPQWGFATVGEIFSDETNPGRKRAFPMRAVMEAVIDQDGGHLERWRTMQGAETSIVWEAHIGGRPVCLIGIESHNIAREGYRSLDGPESWTGGTLFPLSSKKTARAINSASGNRPVVVLANLSGFDGSPESMRKHQLEFGAEIARAVVNFEGPIVFLVVSRYHGGAYVVFSQELNPGLRASALQGSYASVIGGGPAASVVFSRDVRARASAHPRVVELEKALRANPSPEARERFDAVFTEVTLETQAELATEFDAIHSVERAKRVGSLSEIIDPVDMRSFIVAELAFGPVGRN